MTVFTPRFCSSMPQASPVGPAPTTTASKDSVTPASVAHALLHAVSTRWFFRAREGCRRHRRHGTQECVRYRSQLRLNFFVDAFQRGIESRGVLAAALRHIGTPAALSADRLRHRAHQLARVD